MPITCYGHRHFLCIEPLLFLSLSLFFTFSLYRSLYLACLFLFSSLLTVFNSQRKTTLQRDVTRNGPVIHQAQPGFSRPNPELQAYLKYAFHQTPAPGEHPLFEGVLQDQEEDNAWWQCSLSFLSSPPPRSLT